MKLRPITELNARGLGTSGKRFLAAAHALKGATLPNPVSTVIKPGVAAVPAVIGTGTSQAPQTPARAAIAPIKSPVVAPLVDWIGSVSITKNEANETERVVMYLPISQAAIALGAVADVRQVQEITRPGFDLGAFVILGTAPTAATEVDTLINGVRPTVEQYAYIQALALGEEATITEALYTPMGKNPIACFKIDATVSNMDNVNTGVGLN